MKPDLIRRQEAATATLAKYRGRTFDWSAGVTCVHMARFHLRKMGHDIETLPRIRSALAARRAMDDRGWPDVAAMLDSILPRIDAAQMLLGDLAVLPATEGFDGICVFAGFKLLGFHEEADGVVPMDWHVPLVGAWRA